MNDKDWDYLQTLLSNLKIEDLKDNYLCELGRMTKQDF